MRFLVVRAAKTLFAVCFLLPVLSTHAQTTTSVERPLSRFAVGVHASDIGFGGDVVTNVLPRMNLRLAAGWLNLGYRTVETTNMNYDVLVQPRTGEAELQVFPLSGRLTSEFYVGAGGLFNSRQWASAYTNAAGGQPIALGDGGAYISAPSDPIHGTTRAGFGAGGYKIAFGYGNAVSSKHRLTMPVEAGVAFLGNPYVTYDLTGSVCDRNGTNCRTIASDQKVQADIRRQAQLTMDGYSFLQFFPIFSVGLSYNFGHR